MTNIIFMLLLLFISSHGNAQEAKKGQFDTPKQYVPRNFKVETMPVLGKMARGFAEHHGKLNHLVGHIAGRVDITDFSIGNNGHVVPGSPLLTQSLNWRR